jgi:fatty acid desaturase
LITSEEERYPATGLRRRESSRAAEDDPAAARAWFRALDPDRRARIRELHRLRPEWNLVLLLYPALWLAAAAVALLTPSWPIWLACQVAIGVSVHALATLMHEGIHGTLFRRRRLDRWAGFVLGVPALFSFTAYKVAHLAHHHHTRTPRDPDDFFNVSSNRLVRSLVFYAWLAAGMFAYLLHVPLGALGLASRRERRAILTEYALMAGGIATAFLAGARLGRPDLLLHVWLASLPLAVVFGNVRSWAEHALTRPGHPLTHTRTVTSNRLVSFLMCNLNYHLEHHLFPGVPWYNLPRLHALLADEYRRAGAFVHRSYLGFLWEAARAGVHGMTSSAVAEP